MNRPEPDEGELREEPLARLLGQLPEPVAPSAVRQSVLAIIRARHDPRAPWWQRPLARWPRLGVAAVGLVLPAVLAGTVAGLTVLGGPSLPPVPESVRAAWTVGARLAQTTSELMGAAWAAGRSLDGAWAAGLVVALAVSAAIAGGAAFGLVRLSGAAERGQR